MGSVITIVNAKRQVLISPGISQAGSTGVYQMVDGSPVESFMTSAEANWTNNYRHIWNEVGWNPWRWFDAEGEEISITPAVIWMLEGVKLAIESRPGQRESRNSFEEGYLAATPENAATMIEWILTWARQQGATYIRRGWH